MWPVSSTIQASDSTARTSPHAASWDGGKSSTSDSTSSRRSSSRVGWPSQGVDQPRRSAARAVGTASIEPHATAASSCCWRVGRTRPQGHQDRDAGLARALFIGVTRVDLLRLPRARRTASTAVVRSASPRNSRSRYASTCGRNRAGTLTSSRKDNWRKATAWRSLRGTLNCWRAIPPSFYLGSRFYVCGPGAQPTDSSPGRAGS